MTDTRASLTVVGLSLAFSMSVSPVGTSRLDATTGTIEVAASGAPLRILAPGDSYTSGEGMPDGIPSNEAECQRALGTQAAGGRTPAKAWPVLVKEGYFEFQGYEVDPFWLVACTGNTTSQFADQLALTGTQPESFDVAMFTFGGNDVGFKDIIMDCGGIDADLMESDAWFRRAVGPIPNPADAAAAGLGYGAGCERTEDELKAHVEAVLRSSGRLDQLYDQIDAATKPGGLVVVAGYPQIFAEPSTWGYAERALNRCNRLSEGDVRSIRGVTGYLNALIGAEVAERNATSDATWKFVDVAPVFDDENGDGPTVGDDSHGLCGRGQDWITSVGYYPNRPGAVFDKFSASYHPNQNGHRAYANAVMAAIAGTGWVSVSSDDAATVELVDCEGLDTSLLPDGVVEITGTACAWPWALVAFTEPQPRLSVALIYSDSDRRELVTYWTDVGTLAASSSGFNTEAIVSYGVPAGTAQALWAELAGPTSDLPTQYDGSSAADVRCSSDALQRAGLAETTILEDWKVGPDWGGPHRVYLTPVLARCSQRWLVALFQGWEEPQRETAILDAQRVTVYDLVTGSRVAELDFPFYGDAATPGCLGLDAEGAALVQDLIFGNVYSCDEFAAAGRLRVYPE